MTLTLLVEECKISMKILVEFILNLTFYLMFLFCVRIFLCNFLVFSISEYSQIASSTTQIGKHLFRCWVINWEHFLITRTIICARIKSHPFSVRLWAIPEYIGWIFECIKKTTSVKNGNLSNEARNVEASACLSWSRWKGSRPNSNLIFCRMDVSFI